MLEDYRLIIRLHHGDSDALRQIYHKYKDAIYTTALTLLNDYAAADNALHDAFVTFAQRAPGLAIYKSAKVYLAGCIVAQSQTILKRKMYKIEEVPRTFCSISDNSADASAQQHASAVMDAMIKIPQPQREALVLYLYAGLNFSEIARVQRISTTAAKDRYNYGLEKLTGILDKLVENLTEQNSIEDKLKKVRCVTPAELDEQILSDSQAQF
ncbi:MAG: sigma-70 family RNA polymerase sigma factor, partial [Phycisphaerae bacterium]